MIEPSSQQKKRKPFLKWAGNKYRLTEHLQKILPSGTRLIEPFVGSGAVFLNTRYDHYLLAENNYDLINLYTILQNEGSTFITYAKKFFIPENNLEKQFYRLRDQFNQTKLPRLKAALFIYLNKHCYNGLCRYNSKGAFNVPYGRYLKPYFPAVELLEFHQKSQLVVFSHKDFTDTMQTAHLGDVVYCDPPYVPLSETANFTQYGTNGFTEQQHIILAELAEQLAHNHIPVIVSNHDIEFTRKLYKNAKIYPMAVTRTISCNAQLRNKAPELLAVFSPK